MHMKVQQAEGVTQLKALLQRKAMGTQRCQCQDLQVGLTLHRLGGDASKLLRLYSRAYDTVAGL